MVTRLSDILIFLKEFAPLEFAEQWDNVGLLVGDPEQPVARVMTCLTLSEDVAAEAEILCTERLMEHK